MHLIGYHGTSEASARNILTFGLNPDRLPPNGQIGRGFYVARSLGELPEWAAEWATEGARARQRFYVNWITALTGEAMNPLLPPEARRTILQVHATRLLLGCKWNRMNPSDFNTLRALQQQNGGDYLQLQADAPWLQMVVPVEELQYLVVTRWEAGALMERPRNWMTHEYPENIWSQRFDNNERAARAARRNAMFPHREWP